MTDIQKQLKERFDIKNVKTLNTHDGIAIECDIFFDKKKIAHYSNSGCGGCGSVHAYPVKNDYSVNRSKVEELTNLISKLPKAKSDFTDVSLSPDLDWVVEELIEIKKLEKYFKRYIVIGVPEKSNCFGVTLPKNEYQRLSFKGVTDLSKMNPAVLKTQVSNIKKELKKGEIVFNTNV